jgi:RHS repeat-associated protein
VTSEKDKEGTVSFTYDSGGQLTGASGSRTESYGYDSGGNRNTAGYTTGTGNEMTSGGGYTFTYDNEGNVTGKTQISTGNNWTYSYDYRNRMTGALEKNSGGTTIAQATYTYDAENRRIGTKVNGTQSWTAYDGVNPYADFNSSGTLQDRYIYGPAVDEILARIDSSNNVAWYLTDRLGTVRDVVNTTGTVLDHVIYDSFGNVTSETNATNGDRFKFTGREYDGSTGLYYYRARYYDPATGRFASMDPLSFRAGDSDLYRFVRNQPTTRIDPTGLDDEPANRSHFPPPIPTRPTDRPGPDYDWKGDPPEGAPRGGWDGPAGSLHWDPGPHYSLGPHWDWVDIYGNTYRMDPSKGIWHPDPRNNPNRPQPSIPLGPAITAYPPNPNGGWPWWAFWVPSNPRDDWKQNVEIVVGGTAIVVGGAVVAVPEAVSAVGGGVYEILFWVPKPVPVPVP